MLHNFGQRVVVEIVVTEAKEGYAKQEYRPE